MKTDAKISDVIARLSQLKEQHGDLPVCAAEPQGGAYGTINLDDINAMVDHVVISQYTSKKLPEHVCVIIQ